MIRFFLIFCLIIPIESFSQIFSPEANNQTQIPNLNGLGQDDMFVFCTTDNINKGTLHAQSSLDDNMPVVFYWKQFNQENHQYVVIQKDSNVLQSVVSGLSNGLYQVSIIENNGSLIEQHKTWVYNDDLSISIDSVADLCNEITLHSSTVNNNMDIYNTSLDPFIIDSNTVITICLNANHTYVSDLAFYLIGPEECGSPVVELAPHPGSINPLEDVCNAGNDLNNFCFSTASTNEFYVCNEETPLNGTWAVSSSWDILFGCDATLSGWTVQIFDCISQDIGVLTHAELTFTNITNNSSTTVFYDSQEISAFIADNSCSDTTAASHTYVFPELATITTTLNNKYSYQWTCADSNVVFDNNNLPSPTIIIKNSGEYWIYCSVTDSLGSCTAHDSVYFSYVAPVKPIIQYNDTLLSIGNTDLYCTWFLDSSVIATGYNLNEISPTQSGYYRVLLTDSTGCNSIYSDLFYYKTSALNKLNHHDQAIFVYPNPANSIDGFHIRTPYKGTLTIYSLQGNIISHQKIYPQDELVPISNLKAGTYILVFQNKWISNRKLIVII